jgi:hypothetical protein
MITGIEYSVLISIMEENFRCFDIFIEMNIEKEG